MSVCILFIGCAREKISFYKRVIARQKQVFKDFKISSFIFTWNPVTNPKTKFCDVVFEYNYDKSQFQAELRDDVDGIFFFDQPDLGSLEHCQNLAPIVHKELSNLASQTLICEADRIPLGLIREADRFDFGCWCRLDCVCQPKDISEWLTSQVSVPRNFWCGANYINDHYLVTTFDNLIKIFSLETNEKKLLASRSWNMEEFHRHQISRFNLPIVVRDVSEYIIRETKQFV